MLETQLNKLGFSKNETKVYLSLFMLGKSKAGKIIEDAKLHRNLVYTSLESLVDRGLVTKTIIGGVAEFVANDPKCLVEEIEEKKQLARSVAIELKNKQSEEPREIAVYEGVGGIQKMREKSLSLPPGETVYVLGASSLSTMPELESYWENYHKRRVKKGLNAKFLFDHTTGSDPLLWRNKMERTQAKYLPFDTKLPVWFEFFGNQIGIGLPGENPLLFNIKSKDAVEGFKSFFEFFWNQEVVVESGIEALNKVIYGMLNELESGEEYCVMGASAGDYLEGVQKLYDKFHTDRIKKGVITKMLVYKESYEKIKSRFINCGDPKSKVSHLKVSMSAPPVPMQINIFKNKTFFIIYSQEPTVMKFERPEVADAFKAYFDRLWGQDSEVLKGREALKDIWLESIDCGELRFIGARGYFVDRYPELFKEVEEKVKRNGKYRIKNIVDDGMRGHKVTKLPWAETKYLLSGPRNPNVVWLYGNKVVVVNWVEEEPAMFISENKSLVQSNNDYFDELWGKKDR